MGLNIKNEKVERLARQLSVQTGETLTGAIEKALEERLARLKEKTEVQVRLQRIREVTRNLPPPPPGFTSDHSDLYDKDGLPV
jgi:antitoxin VapB